MADDASLYLRKRAQQERRLASARKAEKRLADAHRAVADEYESRADGIDGTGESLLIKD